MTHLLAEHDENRRVEDWRIEVFCDLAAVAPHWDSFAQTGYGLPYQRRLWVEAWLGTIGKVEGRQPRIALVRDARGRLIALLPMTFRNWHAVRILEFAGGKHANFHLPLFEPARFAFANAQGARAFLLRLARETSTDAIIIRNQPVAWRGIDNPLALAANLASSDAGYRSDLMSDPEAYFRSVMSGETRKKLRKKRRLLSAIGDVNFLKASTLAETDMILAAFHRQKTDRLTNKKLANPFEAPGAALFLRTGGMPPKPAIQLFALRADARIVATFGGASDGRNFCGMFNSFDTDPSISRSSPGELMLEDLLSHLCRAGYESFDLGTGDAPYKQTYCRDRIALVDTVLGATPAGRLFAGAMQISGRAKAFVKRHPALMRLAGSAQRLAQRDSQDTDLRKR